MISKDHIKIIQQFLATKQQCDGLVPLTVDGDAGPKTIAALSLIPTLPSHWEDQRKLIGALQHICFTYEIPAGPIDGRMGPQTEYAIETLVEKLKTGKITPWRDDDPGKNASTGIWPRQIQSELESFYGPVGENQTSAISPYPLRIAWDLNKTITKFSCHVKVKDSIERVLKKVLDHYGLEKIQELGLDIFGGCLNVRPIRGGTQYSTHSWGIALDIDPERNKLKWGKDQAQMAKPEYDFWWQSWEEEGAVSLLRTKNFDAMHIQFAKI